MQNLAQTCRKRAYPLATGQSTSYGSGTGVDDGALKKGIAKAYTILTAGQHSGTTNITINSKTDAHSNNCVVDNNTGLMWSRTASASVGPASNGLLPWTTNANSEGIFPYCAAANAAGMAGYSDWRVPNKNELNSLSITEVGSGGVNATAFPSFPNGVYIWSSNTRIDGTTQAIVGFMYSGAGVGSTLVKTNNYNCVLVRG